MRGSLFTGNPALDRLFSRCSAGALEQDDVTEVSLDRLRSRSKNTTEESDGPVRVLLNIRDVGPLELTLVVNRVKLKSVTTGNRCRDQGLHHVINKNEGRFKISSFVVRIGLNDLSGRVVRIWVYRRQERSPRVRIISTLISKSSGKARCKVVAQVVEAPEALLYTKRCDKIRNFRVVVANVIAESCLGLKLVGCLRRTNQ